MSKLDVQKYILEEQRSLPKEERIEFGYHVPLFGDEVFSEKARKEETDKVFSDIRYMTARLARSLEYTKNFRRNGVDDNFPKDADIDVKIEWVMRMFGHWVIELTGVIAKESTLDLEEEQALLRYKCATMVLDGYSCSGCPSDVKLIRGCSKNNVKCISPNAMMVKGKEFEFLDCPTCLIDRDTNLLFRTYNHWKAGVTIFDSLYDFPNKLLLQLEAIDSEVSELQEKKRQEK